MSESCSYNCSQCNVEGCGARTMPPKLQPAEGSSIKHVIGIVSGKGGVGKSFVTASLANCLAREGYKVGILDADVTGASIPRMFGATEGLRGENELIVPTESKNGIKIVSTNLMVASEDTPLAWRGPVISGAITQFFAQTSWGELDYLLIDMPPGTSDVLLTVLQSIPVEGIVTVSAPQELVAMIVGKAVNLAHEMNVRVLGLVENMSYFVCPQCNETHFIFGDPQSEAVAYHYDIPAWAALPINPDFARACDAGELENIDLTKELTPIIKAIKQA